MKICVYPGSFDPFTEGHLDILNNARELFDKVYVSVLHNRNKKTTFTVEERVRMIQKIIDTNNFKNVYAESFDGLTIHYAKQKKAGYIVRGLRAITDFEYEFQLDAANKFLDNSIQTVYFMAKPEHLFLSSSFVKELCSYNADITEIVPKCNLNTILERTKTNE